MDRKRNDKGLPSGLSERREMTANGFYEEVIIAGFGGQGIILAGKLLAQVAMEAGRGVTYMPSYGAEVRGGTANCMVVIAEEEILKVPADEIAVELGNPKVANMVALGAYLQKRGLFGADAAAKCLPQTIARRYHHTLQVNAEALHKGAETSKNI